MNRTVSVTVDSHLRIDKDLIDRDIWKQIREELTISNVARDEAKEAGRYGWKEMPESFQMAVTTDNNIGVMPRGYALQLKLLLREHGIKVKWRDRRRWRKGPKYTDQAPTYRPHQPAAVRAIRKHQQGFYKAPTGSGKTFTVCATIVETRPDRVLILTDRINMVDQWVKEIRKHIGEDAPVGVIGDGKWNPDRITVATIQTLHRKRDEKRTQRFLRSHSMMVLDEGHHATAEMYRSVIDPCTARLRFAVSATPDKTGIFELALNVLGEVFYETTEEELRELGLLVKPRVEVVNTDFNYPYHSRHEADKKGRCEKAGCKNRTPRHKHKDNYADAKKALVTDISRNRLIVAKLVEHYHGHVQIVISNETTQLDCIEEAIYEAKEQWLHDEDLKHVYFLTGKQTRKQRQDIIKQIEDRWMEGESAVILATIAGEGFDMPIIDRVHIVFPTGNEGTIRQNIGRGTRLVDGKGEFVVLDYRDHRVRVFSKHFRTRAIKVYQPSGLEVEMPEEEEVNNGGSLLLSNL